MKLLIADDQQSLHTFFDKVMKWEALGITEIKHAYDGKEAAELAEEYLPDLMIIDIQMPYMNGIQALTRLQSLPRKPKTVILSAYDEFEYARDALRLSVAQYLLKPVDSAALEEALKELIGEFREEREKSLEPVLAGLQQGESMQPEALAAVQAAFRTFGIRSYSVLTVSGIAPEAAAVKETINRHAPHAIPLPFHTHAQGCTVILGNGGLWLQEEVMQLSRQAAESFDGLGADAGVRIGVGGIGDDPSLLPELVLQSRQAAASAFYSKAAVHAYSEKETLEQWTAAHYQKFDQAFEEKIALSFSREALKELVSELFREFAILRLSPYRVYELTGHYMILTEQMLKRSNRLPAEYAGVPLDRLRTYGTADGLERFFRSLIGEIADDTSPAAAMTEETIGRIKRYAELHLAENLSLQTVAAAFGIDKYQLSRLFKQQYGINYWPFVTEVRMKKAAELLAGTALKNSTIAEMTGFVDESHFSKAFKKFYGASPKEYRAGAQRHQQM